MGAWWFLFGPGKCCAAAHDPVATWPMLIVAGGCAVIAVYLQYRLNKDATNEQG